MKYKIFPPIGIARLGNDANFFIGAELPGQPAVEIQANHSEMPLVEFKNADKTKIKKQGARFHLFQSPDGVAWQPATLPAGAVLEWSVTLVNKKSAVVRSTEPPKTPQRPILQSNAQNLVINGGTKSVSGPNAVSAKLAGQFQTTGPNGQPYSTPVELGQLRTDNQGRLIVLGGGLFSSAAPNTPLGPAYYRNPGWHDDVSDGPVTARVAFPDGTSAMAEGGAWVIVAPPDFAPDIQGIVTLFDVMRQVGIESQPLDHVSFDRDIRPMIERTRRLQWVHANPNWSSPFLESPHLNNPSPEYAMERRHAREIILNAEDILVGHTADDGPPFKFRAWQQTALQNWVDGTFDGTPQPAPALTTAALTRAALEGAVGQGFCPGIEAGIIVLDPTLYLAPFEFRIDQTKVEAGDLTALMAQPWQADFLKCNTEWWPTQRPDIAPQKDGSSPQWFRGIAGGHRGLVQNASRLGFIERQGAGEAYLEAERDPLLPNH